MAGSIAKKPLLLGFILLLLAVGIAGLLIVQFSLTGSSDTADNSGIISEQAGAITTGAAVPQNAGIVPGGGVSVPGDSSGDFDVFDSPFATDYTIFTYDASSNNSTAPGGSGDATPTDAPGMISGVVSSNAANGSVPISRITAFLATGNGVFTGASARTDENGLFYFSNLSPGEYRIFFFDNAGAWDSSWYGATANQPKGISLNVTPGYRVHINQELSPVGSSLCAIAGHVTNGAGKGEGGVSVLAYYVDESAGVQLVLRGEALTDDNGDYLITGLQPTVGGSGGSGGAGEKGYKVQFLPPGNEHAAQWYENQTTHETAKLLSIAAGEVLRDIDANLGGGGTISGKVTLDGNQPAASVMVDIFDESGVIVDTQIADESGLFASDSLPAGSYRLRATSRSSLFASEWFNDKPDFASADPIYVFSGKDSSGIVVNLDRIMSAPTSANIVVTEPVVPESPPALETLPPVLALPPETSSIHGSPNPSTESPASQPAISSAASTTARPSITSEASITLEASTAVKPT